MGWLDQADRLRQHVTMAFSQDLSERKPPVSRIRLDSSLRRWFSRNLGLWRSQRLYLSQCIVF